MRVKVQVVAQMCDEAIIWPVVSVVGCNFSLGSDVSRSKDDADED